MPPLRVLALLACVFGCQHRSPPSEPPRSSGWNTEESIRKMWLGNGSSCIEVDGLMRCYQRCRESKEIELCFEVAYYTYTTRELADDVIDELMSEYGPRAACQAGLASACDIISSAFVLRTRALPPNKARAGRRLAARSCTFGSADACWLVELHDALVQRPALEWESLLRLSEAACDAAISSPMACATAADLHHFGVASAIDSAAAETYADKACVQPKLPFCFGPQAPLWGKMLSRFQTELRTPDPALVRSHDSGENRKVRVPLCLRADGTTFVPPATHDNSRDRPDSILEEQVRFTVANWQFAPVPAVDSRAVTDCRVQTFNVTFR